MWVSRVAKWRAHRDQTSEYRRFRREWVGNQVRQTARKIDLPVVAILAVLGPAVYWAWSWSQRVNVDWVGLGLAAVLPPIIFMLTAWLWFRIQAPSVLFNRFKPDYDLRHSSPFAVAAVSEPDGVTFELFPATRGDDATELHVEDVMCTVTLKDHDSTLRSGVLPPRFGAGTHSPATVRYPADFERADWPLPPGKYQMTWNTHGVMGTHALGCPFIIRSPGRGAIYALWRQILRRA